MMIERYEDPKIKEIFSEKRKFQTYFDIEVAYASFVHARYEDKEKNKYLRTVVDENIISSIKEIEKTTKHEMASVVDYLCKRYDSNYIHLGLTSSDILDSTLSIQFINASIVLERLIENLNWTIQLLVFDSRKIQICGRTHGQTASPLFLSEKIKVYSDQLNFILKKIIGNKKFPIKFRGPVGAYSSDTVLASAQKSFERNFRDLLLKASNHDQFYIHLPHNFYKHNDDLYGEVSCSQIIPRSYYVSYISDVILYFTVLDSLCTDLRLLSQDCIGEYSEPFHTGQKGSSSMPHKKNPITLENVSGLTTLIKSFWFTSVANIYSWNERDISHSSNERMYIETLFHLCCNIASKVEPLLKIDNFNIERIEQNLQAAKNIHSADLLTKFCLTEKSSRDELYKGIQESSNENK